jgi:predicted transcriptional regulator of viral defense system
MSAQATRTDAEWRVSLREAKEGATRADQRVARVAGDQSGVIASRQLAACGLDACAVKVRADRGSLHRVFHGVYAVGHDALSRTGVFTAAVLACGDGAILGHHAAAAYHRMRGWDDRDVEVIVPRSGGRRIDGIRAYRSRVDPRDVWTRGGILVTSPARTILDLAATTRARPLRRLVRQALAEGRVSIRQLTDVVDRHRGHRGVAALRRIVADGYVPTRSELEDRALDLIAEAGITRPEVNPRLALGGRTIRPDMFWRELGVVIELDGRRWHADPVTQQDDADKQAILEAHGLRVLRITWQQLVDDPRQTIARIRAALAR